MGAEPHPHIELARTVPTGVHHGQLAQDGTPVLQVLGRGGLPSTTSLAARMADAPGSRSLTREEQALVAAAGVWSCRPHLDGEVPDDDGVGGLVLGQLLLGERVDRDPVHLDDGAE